MSRTVDQKVVQMQFDNAGFEQNAKQTMSTLDKLKAALKFDGANKGAEELNKSIKSIDFSQTEVMATKAGFHIQDVFLKISNVLEYQIARRIINISENIAKSLTLDQITAGFNEYQLKMDSVQTIMASTGEEIQVVNGYLEELNHYSDKTIYSFSDMTQNIGKFTNAGVKLNDAVAAIQGVANVAAVSGANANEASRAMYNFAQALSSGFVKLIDWKSIENANMATVEFKETLLETATALNYCEKTSDGMYKVLTKNAQGKTMDQAISATKNFNDSLAYQWMKTDVLTQALEIYSKDVRDMTNEEIYNYEQRLKAAGFTDQQIMQFEELGIKATDAATKVRTFKQLIDAVKEAIGSGWAMSFEHVVGNLEEAKEVLTKIIDVVSGIVEKISNRRNTLLSNWKDRGGRDSLIKSFENIARAIGKVIEVAKQLWYDLFPPTTSKELVMATRRFEIFTRSLIMNNETAQKLRETLHYLLTPVKILIELIKVGFAIIGPMFSVLQPLLRIFLTYTSALLKCTVILAKAVYHSQTFQKALAGIKTAIATVWAAVKSFVATIGGELVKAFEDSNSWLWKLINGLVFLGKISLGAIVSVFNTIANFKFSDVAVGIDKMRVRLSEFVNGLRESAKESKPLQILVEVIDKLKSAFEFLKEAFLAFITSFSEGFEKVESFSDLLKLIKESAENAFAPIINFFKEKLLGSEGNVFDKLKDSFQGFIDTLKEGVKNIPWTKVLLVAFCLGLAAAVLQLVNAISKFSLLASALRESIMIVNETVKTFTGIRNRLKELKELAVFIASVTFSIALLAMIPKEDLTRAAIALGAVAGGLMVLAEVMMFINKKSILKPGATSQLFASLAGLAAGAAILIAAIVALSELKKTISELLPYIGELGLIMLELIAAMTILSVIGKKLTLSVNAFSALSLIAFAGSVYFLCEALKDLAGVDIKNVKDLTQVLIAVLGGFAVISALTKKIGFWSFAAFIALLIGLKNIVPIIQELSGIELSNDAKRILNLIGSIATIVGVITVATSVFSTLVKALRPKRTIMNKAGSLLGDFSRTLLAIGISMTIMTLAINKLITTIDTLKHMDRLKHSLLTAGAIVVALGAFMIIVSNKGKIFSSHKNGILKFAAAMALMSLTIVPLVLLVEELTKFLQKNPNAQWYLVEAGAVVGGLVTLLGVLLLFTGACRGVDFKLILAVFGSLTLIVGEIGALALLMDSKNGIGDGALAAVGLLLLVLTELDGALFFLSKMKFDAISTGPIIAFTASLTALFTGMLVAAAVLKDEDIERLGYIFAAFLGVIISLAGSLAILSKACYAISWAPILAFSALIASFAASFIAVAKNVDNVDWDHMEDVFNGFMGVVLILAGAGAVLSAVSAGWEVATDLLAIGGAILALAGAMKLIEGIDANYISDVLTNFVTAIIALAGLAGLIGALDYLYGIGVVIQIAIAAIAGLAVSIGVLAAGFGVLSVGAGYLSKQFDEHLVPALISLGKNSETIKTGITALADAIGYACKRIAVDVAKGILAVSVAVKTGIAEVAASIAAGIAKIIQTTAVEVSAGIAFIWSTIVSLITGKNAELFSYGEESSTNFKNGLSSPSVLQGLGLAAQAILGALLGPLGGAVGSFFNIGAGLVGALIRGFRSKGASQYIEQEVRNETYGAVTAMEGEYKTLYQNKKTALAGPATEERKKYFQDFNKDLNHTFLPAMKTTADKTKANAKSTADAIKQTMKDASESSWKDWEIFGHRAGDLWDSAAGSVKNFGQNLIDWCNPEKWMGDMVNYEDIMNNITKAQNEAAESAIGAGSGFEAAGEGAKKGAKGVKEAKDEITSFVEKMEGSFNILDEFDLGLDEENPLTPDKLLANMQSNIDGMTQWSNEMVGLAGKMTQGLYKKLADMGPQGYKYVHAFSQMTEDQLMQVNNLYAKSLIIPTTVTQQIYAGMYQTGQNVYTGLINGMNLPMFQQSGIDAATMLLTGMNQQLGIASPSKKTFQIGIYVTEGLTNGVKDPSAKEGLFYSIKRMCVEIIEKFRLGLPAGDFKLVGYQITDGLKAGIESGHSEVINAVTRVCNQAATSARVALEIHSPSRVFAKIGGFIDAGLAEGISSNADMVENSVSKMADTTVDNLRDAISTIQTAIDSDMDVEPVIKPVVDLSNVTYGANRIGSLMNTNFGTNVTMPAASFMTTSQLIANTDNTNVVDAIGSLREDIVDLKSSISNIKMVLDTGTMVGAMSTSIDNQLGRNRMLAERGI